RHLSGRPVLLLLVGSDLSVMEDLQPHARQVFGRATRMHLRPLHLADVQAVTATSAVDAVDAFLITGGFPEIVRSWPAGATRAEFLAAAVADPLSPLLVSGELTMLGEFPQSTWSRAVLEAVGSGERTFSTIASAAGGAAAPASGTLSPLLSALQAKHVLVGELPLSTRADTRNRRYRIADPYLRFWLAFLQRGLPLVERGRGDLALAAIERGWTSWRGCAVEPLVRDSLVRLLPDLGRPDTAAVGGWWNRQNNPEIDIVGADRAPVARAVHLVGSVKWLEGRPFGRSDYDALVRAVAALPGAGADTPLVAVSRAGVDSDLPLAVRLGPDDLVRAWS
ncbi:MAG: DUF234 domain-containing protein, partial [Actinomycetia bacterium]|nr:DUF234 domain-containing protein [Actinomycetes bacterium]